jgi:hypothetical protein
MNIENELEKSNNTGLNIGMKIHKIIFSICHCFTSIGILIVCIPIVFVVGIFNGFVIDKERN